MKPYKLWQINSNTNRQYLLEDFLEAKASFQTKITREVDESPFLIGDLSKPQTNATFSWGKKEKSYFTNFLSPYLF